LDWDNGLALMRLLQELAHLRERAVILVSHDSRIVEFADRIVRIEDGRIVDQRNIKERTLQTHLLSRTEASLDDRHTLAASSRLERS
jgi:ABC-type lipoprotein export system ATPase subunit